GWPARRRAVPSLGAAAWLYRAARRTADRARRPDRHRTGPGPLRAARPAATNSTSATDRYATGGRSQAWALFGPAARTAPVTTAYSPMASRGRARIRHTDDTMADGTPSVTLSISSSSGGISRSAAATPRMAMAAGRRLRHVSPVGAGGTGVGTGGTGEYGGTEARRGGSSGGMASPERGLIVARDVCSGGSVR